MEIVLKIQGNIHNLMRQCGYYFERQDKEELVFIRALGNSKSGYPRFHIYLKTDSVSCQIRINLHLDQKKPIYQSAAAHAGEYDGDLVEREAERIKQIIAGR